LAGLPLAIELAAGRLRSSTIEELARDLADPLEILRNERRTGPSRHRSLSALFDGSYDALTLVQRDVFERLAVFDGGCTRETAAAVLTATGNPDSGLATNLAALVEQGLVLADTNDAETYFHLPSLLCYYAQRRLRQRISARGALCEARRVLSCLRRSCRTEAHWSRAGIVVAATRT